MLSVFFLGTEAHGILATLFIHPPLDHAIIVTHLMIVVTNVAWRGFVQFDHQVYVRYDICARQENIQDNNDQDRGHLHLDLSSCQQLSDQEGGLCLLFVVSVEAGDIS